jgi:hypothetical protein
MSESWLPPVPPPPPFDDWPPWQPEALEVGGKSYIVVDEIVKPTAVLAITEWPRVDGDGRVRFRLETRPQLVRVEIEELEQHLAEQRTVRVGDVYAAVVNEQKLAPPESEEEAEHLAHDRVASFDWLVGRLENVTPAARDVAKTALYSAGAPVLAPEEAAELTREPEEA